MSHLLISVVLKVGWKDFANARPNTGHLAIAQLEMKGVVKALITQNVDRQVMRMIMIIKITITITMIIVIDENDYNYENDDNNENDDCNDDYDKFVDNDYYNDYNTKVNDDDDDENER